MSEVAEPAEPGEAGGAVPGAEVLAVKAPGEDVRPPGVVPLVDALPPGCPPLGGTSAYKSTVCVPHRLHRHKSPPRSQEMSA